MFDPWFDQQTIDDHFNRMVLSLVERDVIIKIDQFAVYSRAGEAVLHQLLHFFFELTFASAHNRGQNHDAVFRSESHYPLYDLVRRLTADCPSALRAMRYANRRK